MLSRLIMTGKMPIRWLSSNNALRWLSPNGFTTLKMSDNHYIHLRKTFYFKMYQTKIQGYAPDFPSGARHRRSFATEAAPKIPASWEPAGIAATAMRDQAYANYRNI